jgi:predicted RNase H-like HicB family nuclease
VSLKTLPTTESRKSCHEAAIDYPVTLSPLNPEDCGGYFAAVHDLPDCLSVGDSPERAYANALAAIASWIEAAQEMGRPIPDAGTVVILAKDECEGLIETIHLLRSPANATRLRRFIKRAEP